MPLFESKLSTLIAIHSSGILLVIAIVTGAWKYHHVRTTSDHRAPTYVNIAHQASLAYSFSSLVVATLAEFSVWPDWANLTAVLLLLSQFYLATIVYIIQGLDITMENQFATPHRIGSLVLSPAIVRGGMRLLFISEFGGAVILLTGLAVASLSS